MAQSGPNRRVEAQQFVAKVRASTVCQTCGKQPVHWHSTEHDEAPRRRIGTMACLGRPIAEIQAEMDRCIPLCKSCHQKIHGIRGRFVKQYTI